MYYIKLINLLINEITQFILKYFLIISIFSITYSLFKSKIYILIQG